METHIIFKHVQKMRPSCFSVEEQCCYYAEKMMLRQFMLMKQQGQVPDYLSVKDMKTWLLRGRRFLEEFQEINESIGERDLFKAELAWTAARHFCLAQMEEELLEELDKEKQLSQLLSRKVTLEGLQMFVSVIYPAAEEDVQTFLPTMHSNLLGIFGGIQVTSGDDKPAELLELEQSAASLVPEVVDIALTFLLEEPELKDKCNLASAQIGKLLTDSAAPCLSHFVSVSRIVMLCICTTAARSIVKAIFERFDQCSKSFHQMDYDESYLSARYGTICAIHDMGNEKHLRLCTSEGQEEALLQKREVSPQLDENMATAPNDVTEDAFSAKSGTNVAVFMADEIQVLQQEEETQKSLIQHCDLKKKKGVRAFFRGVWKRMRSCFSASTKD
ncbi:uncharacterized protein LOC123983721 [Micropterus dolomieu]|uniref:uncharacterized protein LOC123983721 n=1 Tax=Micropterus dolomieu TaxID=147949 RepID=UPI001E8CC381|nr:uncharacterized protein LOC123983721 [Micropterus dolomieu]